MCPTFVLFLRRFCTQHSIHIPIPKWTDEVPLSIDDTSYIPRLKQSVINVQRAAMVFSCWCSKCRLYFSKLFLSVNSHSAWCQYCSLKNWWNGKNLCQFASLLLHSLRALVIIIFYWFCVCLAPWSDFASLKYGCKAGLPIQHGASHSVFSTNGESFYDMIKMRKTSTREMCNPKTSVKVKEIGFNFFYFTNLHSAPQSDNNIPLYPIPNSQGVFVVHWIIPDSSYEADAHSRPWVRGY